MRRELGLAMGLFRSLEYYLDYCRLVFKKVRLYLWFRARGLPQASILRESSLLKVRPRKNPMSAEEFRKKMLSCAKKTRELQVEAGADEPVQATKIAGQPWWPEGVERPKCKHGHFMNFVAQVLLSDVPLAGMPENSLLSFHYCNQCIMEGRMPFGWKDKENKGYDLSILCNIDIRKPDVGGLAAASLTKSYSVTFRDVAEVPGRLCEDANIETVNLPKDFPQGKDDLDEDIYPGLKHVPKSKIGGWPSWVQFPEWPVNKQEERYEFLGQLDCKLFDGAPWCLGGYAYLFITEDKNVKYRAELIIQVT